MTLPHVAQHQAKVLQSGHNLLTGFLNAMVMALLIQGGLSLRLAHPCCFRAEHRLIFLFTFLVNFVVGWTRWVCTRSK